METKESLSPRERLKDFCLLQHETFDRDIWQKESFHNAEHLKVNINAAKKIIEKAKNNGGNDIFNLKKQLNEWNPNLSWDDFQNGVEVAFSLHDLGNIGQWAKGKLQFFDRYVSIGAEKRSQEIAKHLMTKYDFDDQFQNLAIHLIGQTKIDWEENKPPAFGRFIRACDQLSTNLLSNSSKRKKMLIGLVKETGGQGNKIPEEFKKFAYLRAEKILPQGVSLDEFGFLAGFKPSSERRID